MSKTIKVNICNKHDTTINWSNKNPILALGELGYDTDLKLYKTGDGTTEWNLLEYQKANDSDKLGGQLPSYYVQSNPNLLINGNFQIWQHGTSISVSSDKYYYTADRFRAITFGGTATVTKVTNGLKTNASITLQYCCETIDLEKITGKTVTLSYSKNNVVTTSTFVVSNKIVFSVVLVMNDILNWVKLEIGTHATQNVPRFYGEELILCQRYFYKPLGVLNNQLPNTPFSTTSLTCNIYHPQQMRIAPQIKNLQLRDGASGAITTATAYYAMTSELYIISIINISPAIVEGRSYQIQYEADSEIYEV